MNIYLVENNEFHAVLVDESIDAVTKRADSRFADSEHWKVDQSVVTYLGKADPKLDHRSIISHNCPFAYLPFVSIFFTD